MAEHGQRSVVGMRPVGGTALALGGCAPAQAGRSWSNVTLASDGRLTGFVEHAPVMLEIHADPGRLDRCVPGVTISSTHQVIQYWQERREVLPPQGHPLWVHGVTTLDPTSGQALAEASSGKADSPPGIYPDLCQYAPEGKAFTTVPKEKVDVVFDIEYMTQDDLSRPEPPSLDTEHVAICVDVNLLILVVREWYT